MAKFCTKCGKKLEDGQVCDCEKKKAGAKAAKTEEKVVATETAPTTGIDFNWYANSYLDIIKGLFTKPVDAIKKYATSKNLGLGLVSMVIACIVMGIFPYCFATEGTVSIMKAIGDMAGVP